MNKAETRARLIDGSAEEAGLDCTPLNLKQYVEKGTWFAICIGVVSAYVILCLVCEASLVGIQSILSNWRVWLPLTFIAPVLLLALPCTIPVRSLSSLRGEAIEVGQSQLPQVYECAMRFNARLGLKSPLAIFVLQDSQINAFAFRLRTRNVVVLHDSLVDACLRPHEQRMLEFILRHEMAHHALGHTAFPRILLPVFYRKLSRLDEFSADAVAAELVGDRDVSARAITMLVVGPNLLPHVNLEQLKKQAREVAADKASLGAEGYKTHPLLLRRLSRVI